MADVTGQGLGAFKRRFKDMGDGTYAEVVATVGSTAASADQVQGNVASGAADSGNPIKVGGVHNTVLPTLDSGDRGDMQLDASGRLLVRGMSAISVGRLASSAATTNATTVKASAGTLLSILVNNTNAAIRYLKLYDKATAPVVGTDIPVLTMALEPLKNFAYPIPDGLEFSAGIGYALTTGAADADTVAVGAGDIVGLNILYR